VDFDLKDKERSDQLKKFKNTELQVLLDKNSIRTIEESAKAFVGIY